MDFDIFFGRNVTVKVINRKTLYYATLNNVCFCTTWQNGNKNCSFHSNAVLVQQLLLDFFNLFDSRLILCMLYDSPSLVINALSSDCCDGMVEDKGSRVESTAAVGLCCNLHAQCTSALSSECSLSQGNAAALDRWCGKTKQRPISYFLGNTSAKNYRNRIVCVCVCVCVSRL